MKKPLLLLAILFSAFTAANAQVPYSSGKIAAVEDYQLPDFWGGNSSVTIKTGLDTSKDNYTEFAEAIGIAADATEAQGIRLQSTSGDTPGYAELTLPECGNITLVCWGTGGRGMSIRTDKDDASTEIEWKGGGSYTAIEVAVEINSTEPIVIYLVPTGSAEGSQSTGDTFISEITITAAGDDVSISSVENNSTIIATEYYNIAGLRVNELQKGLNIIKNTYENGQVTVTKEYVK